MALGHKVLDAIDFIHPEDSAIDQVKTVKEDFENYVIGFDQKYLTFVEGKKPTIFRLKQLTHEQKIKRAQLIAAERPDYIIKCGLISIENYFINKNGIDVEVSKIDRDKEGLITQKWINDLNLPIEYMHTVSAAILRISELTTPL